MAGPASRALPAAPACTRFAAGEGLPNCKRNELRFCQMDLASAAWRLRRMVEEDRRWARCSQWALFGMVHARPLKTGLPRCLRHPHPPDLSRLRPQVCHR